MWKHQNIFIWIFFFYQFILLSGEKKLILIPSVAFRNQSNVSDDWILYVQGWFFEENRNRTKLATSALSIILDNIDEKRVSYFTATGKRYKSLCIDDLTYEICIKTDAHGLIKKQFKLTNNYIQHFRIPGGTTGKVEYSISTINKNIQTKGEIFLCDDNGISIISDIDDTIKITGVTSVRSILRNTFSGKYKSVIGMSERYRHYESYYNATFHYLTASPDQLYPFLREFLQREKFPSGSYHMRHLTWFDINFIEFFTSKSFIKQKTKILNMFFQQTHTRKFILFGDIFQKDPEIYANIYKKYPERILKIFIRVSKKKLSNRLNQVFQYIPKYKWDVFVNGFNLPEKIF